MTLCTKQQFLVVASVSALLLISTRTALAMNDESNDETVHDELRFYVGADAEYAKVGFKEKYGANLFAEYMPIGNVHAGFTIEDNFGVEIGYQNFFKSSVGEKILQEGDQLLQDLVPAGLIFTYKDLTYDLKGPYVDFLAYLPVELIDDSPSSLFVGLGVAYVDMKASYSATRRNTTINNMITDSANRSFAAKKPILRAKAGIQHLFGDHVGGRVYGAWQNTSQFKQLTAMNNANSPQLSLKDTASLGLGFFWKF